MTEENLPKDSAIVEQNQDSSLVPQDDTTPSPPSLDELQKETQELMDAIRRLAISEMQAAGDFSREAYIRSVRNARTTLERFQGVTKEQMEMSVKTIESEAEKNWKGVLEEMNEWSNRIWKAAQAAWDVLTAPRDS
ncbi:MULTISPECIES: hypothetical protein [Oscillatoriales]|uniref:hypothetical protein n=1 Tax=Oscillatoriales TaxID=1150 RepID=UPI0001C38A8C|nr:hypothetical protein APPUASWS_024545 [Arthrospira platensis str. Paraca]MDT9311339.1 hypothetical protein [Limnospira sp. Paracas R14]